MPNQRLWPLSSCRRCLPPPPVPSATNPSPQHAIRHLAYHTQQTACHLSYTMFKRRRYFSPSERCTEFSAKGGALSQRRYVGLIDQRFNWQPGVLAHAEHTPSPLQLMLVSREVGSPIPPAFPLFRGKRAACLMIRATSGSALSGQPVSRQCSMLQHAVFFAAACCTCLAPL
jgi:hypothetical protein